ncbi:hypothetical protein EB118_12420 [bacterium]|nr:hypothetical protein [bacterium]NDG30863.1 hypothetical protein [bacterium]
MTDINTNYSVDSFFVLANGDAMSATSGSLVTKGGLGVEKSAHIGEHLTVNSIDVTPSLGDIVFERERTLSNNVTSTASISDFYFNNAQTQSFKAIVSVDVQDTLNKCAIFTLTGTLKPTGWAINSSFTGDITGVKFFINNTTINGDPCGQILYTNSNTSGTTIIRFKANTLSTSGSLNDAGPNYTTPLTLTATNIDYTPSSLANWDTTPSSIQQAIDSLADRISTIRFQYQYYVCKSGDDANGNGSLEKPYLTVSAALTAANNESDSEGVIIHIGPGQFNENLTIIKPNIALRGSVYGNTKTTRINGSITINPRSATGGVFSNYYTFENLSIVASSNHVMQLTGSNTGYLILIDCSLYTSSASVKGLSFTNTTSIKVDIFRTTINVTGSGNENAFYSAAGSALVGTISNSTLYGKTAPTVSINGSSNISFNYTYIDNAGGDNLIQLLNTVIAYFSYCTFVNYQTNSNGFDISSATSLVLNHCVFNIPTNTAYNPLNPGSPPATTVGYVIKGTTGSNLVYGACLFAPVSLVNSTYYWGSKAISNTVNTVNYNTTLVPQA